MIKEIKVKKFNEVEIGNQNIAEANDVISSIYDIDNRLSDLNINDKNILTIEKCIDILTEIIIRFSGKVYSEKDYTVFKFNVTDENRKCVFDFIQIPQIFSNIYFADFIIYDPTGAKYEFHHDFYIEQNFTFDIPGEYKIKVRGYDTLENISNAISSDVAIDTINMFPGVNKKMTNLHTDLSDCYITNIPDIDGNISTKFVYHNEDYTKTNISSLNFPYYDSFVKWVKLPQNMSEVKDHAMEKYYNMRYIYFPYTNTITSIGNHAFSKCMNLQKLVLPDNLQSIGDNAFEYCKNLSVIYIPASLTSIGENAFRTCLSCNVICQNSEMREICNNISNVIDYLRQKNA